MKTQNSNLTFKTLEYCDICDHKGCGECIANALDEHCIPSQFKKQIEDECAKEYEELGLKELKELIEADRKTEPTISKMEQVDKDINVRSKTEPKTQTKTQNSNLTFEKADEPQIYVINPQEPTNDDKCFECDDFFTCGGQCNKIEDEPQTDCDHKCIQTEIGCEKPDCPWK